MAWTEVGTAEQSRVQLVERGIYLVRLAGYLTQAASDELNRIVRRDHGDGALAVIYETTTDFQGYAPELRNAQPNNPALSGIAHIGIVTSNPLLRMVTATIALGLRAMKKIPMEAYGSVELAIAGARRALTARS